MKSSTHPGSHDSLNLRAAYPADVAAAVQAQGITATARIYDADPRTLKKLLLRNDFSENGVALNELAAFNSLLARLVAVVDQQDRLEDAAKELGVGVESLRHALRRLKPSLWGHWQTDTFEQLANPTIAGFKLLDKTLIRYPGIPTDAQARMVLKTLDPFGDPKATPVVYLFFALTALGQIIVRVGESYDSPRRFTEHRNRHHQHEGFVRNETLVLMVVSLDKIALKPLEFKLNGMLNYATLDRWAAVTSNPNETMESLSKEGNLFAEELFHTVLEPMVEKLDRGPRQGQSLQGWRDLEKLWRPLQELSPDSLLSL